MTIRNTTATVLVSTLLFASGTALAASQQTGADPSFDAQLSEAASALRDHTPGGMGREERLTAEQNLQIARDLFRQGQSGTAQAYLNAARGALDLTVVQGATAEKAGSLLSSSRDFYNPSI